MDKLKRQILDFLNKDKTILHKIHASWAQDHAYLWKLVEDGEFGNLRYVVIILLKLFYQEHKTLKDFDKAEYEQFRKAVKELLAGHNSLLQRAKKYEIDEIERIGQDSWFGRFATDIRIVNETIERHEKPELNVAIHGFNKSRTGQNIGTNIISFKQKPIYVVAQKTISESSLYEIDNVKNRRPKIWNSPPRPNQDAVLVDNNLGFICVADGVGGRAGGEIASTIAKNVTYIYVAKNLASAKSVDDVESIVEKATFAANNEILRKISQNQELFKMGTAISFGLVWVDEKRQKWFIGVNVGDSRIYVKKADGEIVQVSKDDSYVRELVESGELNPDDAETHPKRNVITDKLGKSKETLETHQKLKVLLDDGDIVIAMSDGISDNLGQSGIRKIAKKYKNPANIVNALVSEAVRIATKPKGQYKNGVWSSEGRYSKADDMSVAAIMAIPLNRQLTKKAA